MKPIQTRYAGHFFRSRLEARWARYFDALKIQWEYEPEGFDMDGVNYLPDFYLPQVDLWAEVKPSWEDKALSEEELKKIVLLSAHTGKGVILLQGRPNLHSYVCYTVTLVDGEIKILSEYLAVNDYHNYFVTEKRFFVCMEDDGDYPVTEGTINACSAANCARYEWGKRRI